MFPGQMNQHGGYSITPYYSNTYINVYHVCIYTDIHMICLYINTLIKAPEGKTRPNLNVSTKQISKCPSLLPELLQWPENFQAAEKLFG